LGGLDWEVVRSKILRAFEELPEVHVSLFEPVGAPNAEAMARTAIPAMTPGRAVLVELMSRYLAAVMDPFVTLLEIHKLMYFMQEAGEELQLKYVKAPYGPYATNLRHVLSQVEGHFISGYGDAEDDPGRAIELLPEALEPAYSTVQSHPQTKNRFERVAELISGFETPFGMELLSTVHWVCTREGATSIEETIHRTYSWSHRKQAFDPQQISLAREVLASQGWLASGP
jgi:O-acetyl-ADP-ribose deacetylase (regulator of RNase III)